MKPDWDRLGASYHENEFVVIGDVDCTADENRGLCSTYGVKAYPTLKYFEGGDDSKYEGGRDYDALNDFIEENLLKKACDANNQDSCIEDQMKNYKKPT
eukprot:UN06819